MAARFKKKRKKGGNPYNFNFQNFLMKIKNTFSAAILFL